VPANILRRDEEQWRTLRDACAPLVAADHGLRAPLREAERRLAVVAAMRDLYRGLREDKARLATSP
jgi:hypothetical protein